MLKKNILEIINNRGLELTQSSDIHKNLFRHFKGEWYEFIGISKHTETEEISVVYKALYDNKEKGIKYGDIFNKPIEMFYGETDKEKYPDAIQKYRLMNYYELLNSFNNCDFTKMIKNLIYKF